MNFQIYNFPLFFSYNLGKKPLCPPKYFVFLCFRKQMKKLLIFQEMKLFKLKNSCFFRRTLRVFHHCFFGCLHFLMFSFLQMFSGVFIVDCIYLLHYSSLLLLLPRLLRIWKSVFYSDVVFTLHLFSTFGTTCFYQGFPGADGSALKVTGVPTEVRNTDSTHLFVWIGQCSAKGITW